MLRSVRRPKGVITQSSVAVPLTGTASETTLAAVIIPAGLMGTSGTLRITTLWSGTNSANNKIVRIKFGGASGTKYLEAQFSTLFTTRIQTEISNRNSASSQVGACASYTSSGGWGQIGGALVTSSVDTSADTTVIISGQLSSSSETLTLERYIFELLST